MTKPTLYVTNKELLKEINNSKKSFCYFTSPLYENFDVIVRSLDEVTDELLEQVIEKKSKPKKKGDPVLSFNKEDIIIRLMDSTHIPLDPLRKRKARNTDISYTRTNFPPFKHYVVREGDFIEVGRSHWKGDLETGIFCQDHGKVNDRLARLFILLVERYSSRGNFRNYSYIDEMRASAIMHLSQVCLQFDESKSDNPFAFYTTSCRHSFVRILNLEKRSQSIRDDLLLMSGSAPSYTRQIENELSEKFPVEQSFYNTKKTTKSKTKT